MRVVLASGNAKKLAELQRLLAPAGVELVGQGAHGVDEAEEPHITFLENALAKARHASRRTGAAAIADDSGLCVDALGGAPGVVSARFALVALPDSDRELRRSLQDDANNTLLIERLHGVKDRRASFVSVLVALRNADDPQPLVSVGRWVGELLRLPSGSGGFGYDPLMFIPSAGCTVAQMSADVKNAGSHRALASRRMLRLLRTAWHLG